MSKKQSRWFSHDSNAHDDPKLIALISAYGMEGYGRWWRLLEILRAEDRYRYNITTKFAYTVLAKELLCTIDEAKQFITSCIEEYELLHTDKECIWSESLCARMEFLDSQRASYSERGKKSAEVKRLKRSTETQQISNSTGTQLQLPSTNKTKQKETKQQPQTAGGALADGAEEPGQTERSSSRTGNEVDWDTLKTRSLADTSFTYPFISSGKVSETQLAQWLSAFNKLLAFRAEAPKSEPEYRRHFANWFKFRDPAKEDPETFLLPEARNKAPVVISTQNFLKTPLQIAQEQAQQQEAWKKRASK